MAKTNPLFIGVSSDSYSISKAAIVNCQGPDSPFKAEQPNKVVSFLALCYILFAEIPKRFREV